MTNPLALETATMTPMDNLDDPVMQHARTDFMALHANQTVQEALDSIRTAAKDGSLVYFYVVDETGLLIGVLQTRKLLTSPLDSPVRSIMTENVVAIPDSFSLLDACEFFVLHKFLAFPVVDSQKRVVGVVDVGLFAKEMFDIEEREQLHSIFETLGVQVAEARSKSAWSVFRFRFPWLLATIISGTVCAVMVGLFDVTLAKSLILAFFLTPVLSLGESVSMQTMALTAHSIHHENPGGAWYWKTLKRELSRTFLLGVASGAIVGSIAVAWKHNPAAGIVIAGGILTSLLTASFLGVSIPVLLHRLRLDLRVASGPVTLAVADVFTIAIYFSLAGLVLGQ